METCVLSQQALNESADKVSALAMLCIVLLFAQVTSVFVKKRKRGAAERACQNAEAIVRRVDSRFPKNELSRSEGPIRLSEDSWRPNPNQNSGHAGESDGNEEAIDSRPAFAVSSSGSPTLAAEPLHGKRAGE